MQKITPFLWFDNEAEDAAAFYTSLFDNSRITNVSRYDKATAEAAGRAPGSAMVVAFELDGQAFTALNGGPAMKINPAISFVVNCKTQDEVDHFWNGLSAGGSTQQCGWLTDRFGVAWQIVPTVLPELASDPDPEKAARVMAAMLEMEKLDIAGLRRAYEQA